MIQRTPLILLAIALLLGAFVYFYDVQGKPQREAAQAQTEPLFAFKEAEVRSFTLVTPTQTLSFAKTPAARVASASKTGQPAQAKAAAPQSAQASTESLVWAMTTPAQTVAKDASVAYLLNLMSTSKRQQTLTVPTTQQAEFGFDRPLAIAEVKLANQQRHRLVLGKPNFNHSALYAQVDPPLPAKTELAVVLVSTDFENAVNRPLADWKDEPAAKQPATPLKEPKPEPTKP